MAATAAALALAAGGGTAAVLATDMGGSASAAVAQASSSGPVPTGTATSTATGPPAQANTTYGPVTVYCPADPNVWWTITFVSCYDASGKPLPPGSPFTLPVTWDQLFTSDFYAGRAISATGLVAPNAGGATYRFLTGFNGTSFPAVYGNNLLSQYTPACAG